MEKEIEEEILVKKSLDILNIKISNIMDNLVYQKDEEYTKILLEKLDLLEMIKSEISIGNMNLVNKVIDKYNKGMLDNE